MHIALVMETLHININVSTNINIHYWQVNGAIVNIPRILVSVIYTYWIIIEAAKRVQSDEKWRDDEK